MSDQQIRYDQSRPAYPEDLISFVARLSCNQHAVLDCATGDGRAAMALSRHFNKVYACDINFQRIQPAPSERHPNIYRFCANAESLPVQTDSVDLITIAQAWHWFASQKIEEEASRVLCPGGHLVIWGCNLLSVNDELDPMIRHFYHHIVSPYWPDGRSILEEGYQCFPYQLTPIPCPSFAMEDCWSFDRLRNYLLSWLSTRALLQEKGSSYLDTFFKDLHFAWGYNVPTRRVQWPVILKAAKNS